MRWRWRRIWTPSPASPTSAPAPACPASRWRSRARRCGWRWWNPRARRRASCARPCAAWALGTPACTNAAPRPWTCLDGSTRSPPARWPPWPTSSPSAATCCARAGACWRSRARGPTRRSPRCRPAGGPATSCACACRDSTPSATWSPCTARTEPRHHQGRTFAAAALGHNDRPACGPRGRFQVTCHPPDPRSPMARIIAIANQKGGVGKTTTAVNLAAALAGVPKKLLLVDLDAQGNATMGSGVDKRELDASTCDVLLGEQDAAGVIVAAGEGYDLMPGNTDLTAAEIELMDAEGREQRLKRALEPLRPRYDYIIVDCPPALSLLTLNALTAADSVLVPMQCEYYALEGITALMETIKTLKARLNPGLEIEGVLRTMFDVRNNLTNAVSDELVEHFGDQVFRTIVPRNVRLAEAPSHGQSIVGYDRASRGAIAYLGLAGEIIRRQRERETREKAA